jgi:S-adenosylmethionine decarboxylase
VIHSPAGIGKAENAGFDAFLPLIDSGISLYVLERARLLRCRVVYCKRFDVESALAFTANSFAQASSSTRAFE